MVGVLIFFYIAFFAIWLTIWYFVAKQFERIAFDKGYGVERHSFAMVFWFGIVGILYVFALPDRNLYQESEKEDPLPNMLNELQKCKDLLDMGVITQQEFEAIKKHLLGV